MQMRHLLTWLGISDFQSALIEELEKEIDTIEKECLQFREGSDEESIYMNHSKQEALKKAIELVKTTTPKTK